MTDLFLDTSVFLGYIFPQDRWEKDATACLLSTMKKYTSTSVESEMQKKIEYVRRTVRSEILGLIQSLSQQKDRAITDSEIKRIEEGLRRSKIAPIVKELLNELKAKNEKTSVFCTEARNALRIFTAQIQTREDEIKEKIGRVEFESWTRYEEYEEIRKELSEWIANDDDIEILLDAHDLVVTVGMALEFVTSDYGDFKFCRDKNPAITKIARITFLPDFARRGSS